MSWTELKINWEEHVRSRLKLWLEFANCKKKKAVKKIIYRKTKRGPLTWTFLPSIFFFLLLLFQYFHACNTFSILYKTLFFSLLSPNLIDQFSDDILLLLTPRNLHFFFFVFSLLNFSPIFFSAIFLDFKVHLVILLPLFSPRFLLRYNRIIVFLLILCLFFDDYCLFKVYVWLILFFLCGSTLIRFFFCSFL